MRSLISIAVVICMLSGALLRGTFAQTQLTICELDGETFQFCLTDVLDFEIYWNVLDADSALEIAFDVPDNGWHSLGFSSEAPDAGPMPGSNVVFGCASFVDTSSPASVDYFLGARAAAEVNIGGNQALLSHTEARTNGRCSVRFTRLIAPENLDENQHLVDGLRTVVIANGDDNLGFHSDRIAFQVNFAQGSATEAVQFDPVRVAHGAMMAIAFGLCFPLGILSAHHKKAIYKGRQLGSLKLWFQVHRSLMPLGALLSTVSFTLILIQEREFFAETAHLVLGCVVMSLIWIQFSFVRLRPKGAKPGEALSTERRRWNLAHWWNGRTAATLAFVNTVFGFFILNPPVAYFALFLVVAGLIFITYLVLDVASCFSMKEQKPKQPPQDDVQLEKI